ncbi:MAG: LD-carboxypeptidase [Bacteroidetes bacterium]|nr:LD-carboxypeptidase [Bacteroidota bacterium]
MEIVETKHALASAEFIYRNPKARAEDLMDAFRDPSIKAIISNIDGEDSIRILPYIDLDIIRANPKILLGFSDSTVTHFICYRAGITSFYGTSILTGFAENGGMHRYQIDDLKRMLFSAEAPGVITPNKDGWTSERSVWEDPAVQHIPRKLQASSGWKFLQGSGKVQGRLIGGCIDVLEFLKDTDYWPVKEEWKDTVLFLETSEDKMLPENFRWILRNYAASGILRSLKGIIMGRPYDYTHTEEYNRILLKIVREEEGLTDLAIITEMDFGHTSPTFTIPMGVMAEIDMDRRTFSMLESGVE